MKGRWWERAGLTNRGAWLRAAAFFFALLLATPGGKARGGEFYYIMVFGSQTSPKLLRYTHTWATFIRAVGEGTDPSSYALEAHTISWFPRTLDIRVLRPWPEPGANLDLYQTLAVVQSQGEQVTMWGPFLLDKAVYDRSLWVRQVFESGIAQYRAISGPGNLLISDCIHAVAAVDPEFGRENYPLIRIGKPASRYIARQIMIRSPLEQEAYDNSWLIPRLGLDRYAIGFVSPRQIPRRDCLLCLCPE